MIACMTKTSALSRDDGATFWQAMSRLMKECQSWLEAPAHHYREVLTHAIKHIVQRVHMLAGGLATLLETVNQQARKDDWRLHALGEGNWLTSRFCPILCARACAWRSIWGFQSVSYMMTVSAA